ncbi:MAG: hypothetical protein JXR96_28230 [Deltaproteobacteria bacterium]|nr:hypothetical protein [Deltaproteobacteria bacterium]
MERALVFMLLCSLCSASSAVAGDEVLRVPAGIHKLDKAEVYLESFEIDRRAVPEKTENCAEPSVEQWLVAAGQKGFEPSKAYEYVATPPKVGCDYSQEEVEAEGVAGQYYFAGLGEKLPGEAWKRSGSSVRDTISVVPALVLDAWGQKPSPVMRRCLRKVHAGERVRKYVLASTLNLRAGRSSEFEALEQLRIAMPLEVVHAAGDWRFVEVEITRKDNGCKYRTRGWVMDRFLTDEKPDADKLYAEGRKLLEAGKTDEAIPELQRAASLRLGHRPTLEALRDAYRKAGRKADAEAVEKDLHRLK